MFDVFMFTVYVGLLISIVYNIVADLINDMRGF